MHRNRSSNANGAGNGGTIAMLTTSHGTVAVSLNLFDHQHRNNSITTSNSYAVNDNRLSSIYQSQVYFDLRTHTLLQQTSIDQRISSPPTISTSSSSLSSNNCITTAAHINISYDDDAFNYDQRGPGRKSSLPKRAVDVLKDWLFRHVTVIRCRNSQQMTLSLLLFYSIHIQPKPKKCNYHTTPVSV